MTAYDALASVYDWLVPDMLLEPEGAFTAFAGIVADLPAGARVLDCACGTGQLAVGLALHGFDVTASDASPGMVDRTRALAAAHHAEVRTAVSRWEDLRGTVDGRFDAVFCVGNSLTHAEGATGRRAALAAMADVLTPRGALAVTSRNWERLRDRRPGLEVDDALVQRAGRAGLAIRSWSLPEEWEAPHHLEVAVAVLDGRQVVDVVGERLTFWPFTHRQLTDELHAAGLKPTSSSHGPDVDRYVVVARRGNAG
ncbi:MAG TPA: class I SAM-dependent methyltransferase [Euzebyales bacterium]